MAAASRSDRRRSDSPDTNELDRDIDREVLLEIGALLPAERIRAQVHLIRELDLLAVVPREQANLMQHSCECAGNVSTAREAEEAVLVACSI